MVLRCDRADLVGIASIESLRHLPAEDNPLSIFGRWDLGYGQTDYPKTIPDGFNPALITPSPKGQQFLVDATEENPS